MMILAAALAVLIGGILGMLGGGGAILTLPMLVYLLGVEAKVAIPISLFVVGSTSLVGGIVHARSKAVRWKLGAIFGGAAMAGAFGGGRLAELVPASVLLVTFAVIMLVTALAMLWGRAPPSAPRPFALVPALALGVAVGLVSGLVGAGGGFLIVPTLTLFGGLEIREAIGTSLVVIALQSFAGFAGHALHVQIDWTLALVVTAATAAGTVGGSLLARRLAPEALRGGFAWLVLVMGLVIVSRQLPLTTTVVVGVVTLVAVLAVLRARPRGAATTSSESAR